MATSPKQKSEGWSRRQKVGSNIKAPESRPWSRNIFICAALIAGVLIIQAITGDRLSTRQPGRVDRQERVAMLIIPLSLAGLGIVVRWFEQRKR